MSECHEPVHRFVEQARATSGKIASNVDDVHQRVQDIRSDLDKLRAVLRAPVSHDEVFRQFGEATMRSLQDALEQWTSAVERVVDGRQFVAQFDRSLIVVVSGIVNSGKSSIGNLISGEPFRGSDPDPYAGLEARFRVHEHASDDVDRAKATSSSRFAEGATECTGWIQEFTMGGLTWVDTPGLRSLTPENGALALRYVEEAELVVYVTSSDAPMRACEQEELKALVLRAKPTMLIVSKFDMTEEDWDDENECVSSVTVPKNEQSRVDQQAWIEAQIADSGMQPLLVARRFAFTSRRIAMKALSANDGELFHASGIPSLFDELGRILCDDAVELKAREPRRRVNKLIDDIIGSEGDDAPSPPGGMSSIRQLRDAIAQVQAAAKAAREKITGLRDAILRQVKTTAGPRIQKLVNEKASALPDDGDGAIDAQAEINIIIKDELRLALQHEVKHVVGEFDHAALDSLGAIDAIDVEALKKSKVTVNLPTTGRDVSRGQAIGGGLGTLAGFFIPVPVLPEIVLGGLGGWLGGKLGHRFAGHENHEFIVGDNADEVVEGLYGGLEASVDAWLDPQLQQLANNLFDQVDAVMAALVHQTELLQVSIMARRYNQEVPS